MDYVSALDHSTAVGLVNCFISLKSVAALSKCKIMIKSIIVPFELLICIKPTRISLTKLFWGETHPQISLWWLMNRPEIKKSLFVTSLQVDGPAWMLSWRNRWLNYCFPESYQYLISILNAIQTSSQIRKSGTLQATINHKQQGRTFPTYVRKPRDFESKESLDFKNDVNLKNILFLVESVVESCLCPGWMFSNHFFGRVLTS